MTLELEEAAEAVYIELADKLSLVNPALVPTLGFTGYGGMPPSASNLGGTWTLRLTAAADATLTT